ncbi:TonB-dependent receptor domain-containing protein [Azorhizobium oxalatiphilum]|nr:TonB-dependent receptor [Azorhizobium oxalatiphilum]
MIGISLLPLLVAGPALAQQTTNTRAASGQTTASTSAGTATANAPVVLPTVTVSEGGNVLVGDPYQTPAAVSSVDLLNSPSDSTRLDSVLRSVPGTFTEQSTSNPGVAVNIRGFQGMDRVNMMIDGVRQNFRFVGHEAGGFTYVDDQLLAGVDVARGAVSTAGGAGALAGAVNMRTLGIDDIIKPGKSYGAMANIRWGSNGVGWQEMFAGAARVNDRFALGAAIATRDSGNYKNGDDVTVPYTSQELTSGLVKTDIKLTDTSRLKLGGVFYNNFFYANSAAQNVINDTLTANYSYDPGNDLVDFKLNAYYNATKMKYGTSSSTISSYRGRVIEDKGWGFDTSNTSKLLLGQVAVKSTYGLEYFHDDVDAYNTVTPSSYGGVNPSGTSSIGGVFSETTFTYGMVDLIAGLRYDFFTLNGSGYENTSGGAVPIGYWTVDRNEGRFDPKITLAVNPLDWLQPYVTYAETMRAPTASETMVGGEHPGSSVSYSANPYLEPEVSKGWEFGLNIRKDSVIVAGDKVRLKVDYFTNDIENYIVTCRSTQYYFCNVAGTSNVSGVEMQASYDAGKVFADMSYTHNDNDLPAQTQGFGANQYLPDDIFTFSGGVRLFDEKLVLGARYSYISEGQAIAYGSNFTGVISSTPSDSYSIVDLFGSYALTDVLTLRVDATNLLNEAYTPALSIAPTGFSGDTGQGRTFLVSLRAHL